MLLLWLCRVAAVATPMVLTADVSIVAGFLLRLWPVEPIVRSPVARHGGSLSPTPLLPVREHAPLLRSCEETTRIKHLNTH